MTTGATTAMQKLAHLARTAILAVVLAGTRSPWELRALTMLLAWALPNLLVAFVAPNGATILLGLAATNALALGLVLRRAYRLPPSRETEWAQAIRPTPAEAHPLPADFLDTVPLEVAPHAPVATKSRTYVYDN